MNNSTNSHINQPRTFIEMVWFDGDGALLEGVGVCYDADYGTAADVDGSRMNRVSVPSNANNNHFAGVTSRAYRAKTGGQFIEIYNPGSVCLVLANVNTTIDSGMITCVAGGTNSGKFMSAGFAGRGSAIPLQTVTAGNKCLAKLLDGNESGLVEYITPPTTGGNGTLEVMTGGLTILEGTVTIGTGNAKATLANGTYFGQRKAFKCTGTYTTNDAEITLATAGKQQAVGTSTGVALALTAVTFDAANEIATLEWDGVWKEVVSSGCGLSAS